MEMITMPCARCGEFMEVPKDLANKGFMHPECAELEVEEVYEILDRQDKTLERIRRMI